MRVDGVLAVPIGRRPELTTCRQAPTCRRRPSASRADSRREARSDRAFWWSRPPAAGTVIASGVSSCPAPHDIGTVACQSSSSPPSWCSCWEAVRYGPPREEGTAAAPSAEATAVGVCREAQSSGVAAPVEDQSRTSTTTTTTAGHSSCSRTSTTPTTGTTRTAIRIHLTTPLNTATGTVRRTAAMPLLQSELGLPAQLYDRPFGGARVQPRKRLQVAILALLAVALAAPGPCSSAHASAWELDPAATRIAFSVK